MPDHPTSLRAGWSIDRLVAQPEAFFEAHRQAWLTVGITEQKPKSDPKSGTLLAALYVALAAKPGDWPVQLDSALRALAAVFPSLTEASAVRIAVSLQLPERPRLLPLGADILPQAELPHAYRAIVDPNARIADNVPTTLMNVAICATLIAMGHGGTPPDVFALATQARIRAAALVPPPVGKVHTISLGVNTLEGGEEPLLLTNVAAGQHDAMAASSSLQVGDRLIFMSKDESRALGCSQVVVSDPTAVWLEGVRKLDLPVSHFNRHGGLQPAPAELAARCWPDSARLPDLRRYTAKPPLNTILHGPPGTGKTYSTIERSLATCGLRSQYLRDDAVRGALFRELMRQGRIEFVTLHQSYGYEEFVQGLRPVKSVGEGGLSIEVHDGALMRIALRAMADGAPGPTGRPLGEGVKAARLALSDGSAFTFGATTRPHVLVLDEINRANVSKVLGELITLLEDDKRLAEANEIRLPLAYTPESRFALPPNLHVLATMNTADRSIALLDAALRRRFKFEETPPNPEVLDAVLKSKGTADEVRRITVHVMKALNERLEFLYDRDHQIGHVAFLKVRNLCDLRDALVNSVIPLLKEYFYASPEKIFLVLGSPHAATGIRRENPHPILRLHTLTETQVLGFNHPDFEDRKSGIAFDPEFVNAATDDAIRPYLLGIGTPSL